ncbi:hypothetical protein AWE51_16890 [Aquimarina aggregata]|uniref:HTH araC/xylS-type domain-containing protein n=2 Tax=Aquimarina aggregata TaxID=1642818 RepID=A0A163D5X0_9FLAO|nr:hypothetical protein AWE51_16890 [Aquimarina aggregata]
MLFVFLEQINGQSKASNATQEVSNFDRLRAKISTLPDSVKIQTLLVSLNDAKSQADTLAMADAYYFLSRVTGENQTLYKNSFVYADSLIVLTEGKGYFRYPARGYLSKGIGEYEHGNYEEALGFYLIASKSAKNSKNELLYRTLKFNIGLLKDIVGEIEEAQTIFVEYLNFLDQNPKYKNAITYNRVLFAVADSYLKNNQFDLAKRYTNIGIRHTLKIDDSLTYSYLVINSGIIDYQLKSYHKAIDSLEKGKKIIQKSNEKGLRIALCDYYIGLSYDSLGEIENSILYFENVNKTLEETEYVVPRVLDAYNYLIKYYKFKQNVPKQIEYINSLLKFDSIKDDSQIHLIKGINKKYDTVELISEKERLITELKHENFFNKDKINVLTLFLIVLILIAIYGYRRNYINKKRFLKLLNKTKQNNKISNKESSLDKVNISKEVVDQLLGKLLMFEKQEIYLQRNINSKDLAKRFNSNSSYLSLVVNRYKGKSMNQYINDLRIDFIVEKLQSDTKFRKYTIKAIAQEIGFNTAESFAKAFRKKTGIYPSYFIKNLKNDNKVTI